MAPRPVTDLLLLAGFCGTMSIFSSLRYALGDPDSLGNLWLALVFLPFGFFFDAFDGKVARWRKKSSLMGQELDSLADLVGHNRAMAGHKADTTADLIWCSPCHGCFQSRPTLRHRHPRPHLFRPLRPHSPRPLQRDRLYAPQGRHRQEQVL